MLQQNRKDRWMQRFALFLVGIWLQFVLCIPTGELAQAQNPPNNNNSCSIITTPLTAEEQTYAKAAWQYFVNNYQESTGFTNSTGGYPSGTLWDMGNYLMALNAARWLDLIPQSEFDQRFNKFLTGLGGLKLFEDALPNKVYHAANGAMVDYGNNPIERGIGWSALDIGRMLAAFDIVRTCHPGYGDWIKGILAKWQIARSLKDEQLFGATIAPDKSTMLVQEGRLGYEEYAVRGYELWGFKAPKAAALEPFELVDVNGVKLPVDKRDYKSTNANNYVVSESYILDGLEFGLGGYLKEYTARVLEAQKRRFETTGQLTAVTEDNIDREPYFLYNTLYSNGKTWATITEKNEDYPQLRSISTKAAFGWKYLYPDNPYAQKVFDAVKDLRSPDGGGFYAGLYEETKQPNKSLTGNTNGLIMEMLYYKARGNKPLIGGDRVGFAPFPSNDKQTQIANNTPANNPSPPPPANNPPPPPPANNPPPPPANNPSPPPPANNPPPPPPPANNPSPPPPANNPPPPPPANNQSTASKIEPIPPVGEPKASLCPVPEKGATVVQQRYARAAWAYFQANSDRDTGLISDRSDLKGATLWGLGDYLAALHAARTLDIISVKDFDRRTRYLLGALSKIQLFTGELPNRGYDIRTLQPVDYAGNPVPEGTGWSSLDTGRVMAALHMLKTCHPEYTDAVDNIALDWSYLRVVRDGILSSATLIKDQIGRSVPRVLPETRLGYEEYAARGFQVWGFNADRSAVGGDYEKATIEGVDIPVQRRRKDTKLKVNQYTVSNPFLLYGLEFGFDPQMRAIVAPIMQAQAERYRRTGKLTASGTTLINRQPYTIHNSIVGRGEPWATLTDDGTPVTEKRLVSTAVAYAYHALFPEDAYGKDLMQGITDLYNPTIGYYEGFYESDGKSAIGFTSSTNSMILESLLYQLTQHQPLIRPNSNSNSPWWKAIDKSDSGRGLPMESAPRIRYVSDRNSAYWLTTSTR